MEPALPPGPTGSSLVSMMRWIWSPIALFEQLEKKYGEYFTVRLPGSPPNVVFTDPAAVKDLFTASADEVRVKELSGMLRPVLGEHSVMVLDGPKHLRQRKLMMPPFHGERMRAYGAQMQRSARGLVEGLPRGAPFALMPHLHAVTLDIILHSIIGVAGGAEVEPMREAVSRFLSLGTSPIATVALLATPTRYADSVLYAPVRSKRWVGSLLPWAKVVRAQDDLDALLYAEVAARRSQGEGFATANVAGPTAAPSGQPDEQRSPVKSREDVLSLLMAARDEQGQPLSDVELRDEVVTLLLAGHETTATTLAWAAYHLLRTPAALGQLRDALGDAADLEAVVKNEYLDWVLRETMRLSPVALVVGRHLVQPMRLGKWQLPAGVNALASLYLVQRRADVWEQPDAFKPERFETKKNSPYDFFPFGGGARRCIGMAFAYYEMKIILAELVRSARLELADAKPIRAERKSIVFAPSRGLLVARA